MSFGGSFTRWGDSKRVPANGIAFLKQVVLGVHIRNGYMTLLMMAVWRQIAFCTI